MYIRNAVESSDHKLGFLPGAQDDKMAPYLEPLKDKLVEISTTLKYEDKNQDNKKSYFEIIFCTVIKVSEEVKEKKDIEKIILCDVQRDIYPNIEASFLNLLHNSGYPEVKFEKKIDFEKLYSLRFN